jgi:asparagine synthetase B (glutamine-hydrolysing)
MIFLNTDTSFKEIKTEDYEFFYKGNFSLTVEDVIHSLRIGSFPSTIKGNFSFFYKDNLRTVIVVDHLPTINMFYSEEYCSHIFFTLTQKFQFENALKPNYPILGTIKCYWGGSVGEQTSLINVKRVLPGCYIEITPDGKTKSIQYRNIYEHVIDQNISLEEIRETIEFYIKQSIADNPTGKFGLLHSSGTDSNTILGFFRKLGIVEQCMLLSVKGQNEFISEAPFIDQITKEYNLKTNWLLVSNAGESEEIIEKTKIDSDFRSAFARTYKGFWTEPQVMVKYHLVKNFNFENRTIFTGEVGDQIFGSRFGKIILKFILQKPNCSIEEIAKLFLISDRTRFKKMSLVDEEFDAVSFDFIKKGDEILLEWFINTWNKIQVDDLINKIELMQYFYKGSHRIYNYSQFRDLTFAHPFADSELFDKIWKLPGSLKINNGGVSRSLSYDLIKDHITDLPWKLNKTGIGVLAQELKFSLAKERVENARKVNLVS